MDALGISGIVMNSDSEDNDLDDSCSDFDDGLDLMTSDSKTDSDDDAILAAPPSQAMAAKKQYIWCPSERQPPVTAFMGMQGPNF